MDVQQNRGKLMWASFLSLIAAGVGFAVRGGILLELGAQFGFTQGELGTISGAGMAGFGIVILAASTITDRIGYRTILVLAFILHIVSALVTVAAAPVYDAAGKGATFVCLYSGFFIFAVANGLCEAVINPLIANLYPAQKTHYLNILHAGWPGGLILGGLLAKLLVGNVPWEIAIVLYLIPAVMYGVIVLREPFPQSEVTRAGIGIRRMLLEFASPILLFLLFLNACVGYVEVGTDSWITNITESMLTGQGLLLFIYASSIMFVLRFFAGPIVERINPLGLLCVSSVLGAAGLYMIGSAQSAILIWLAVTIYGVGKTFLWPTMLGVVGERFPRGGALTLGAIGGVGALSAGYLGTPGIGYLQDVHAAKDLKAERPAAYERYAAGDEIGFLLFPKVRGLDNQKVGVLLDSRKGQWVPGRTLNDAHRIARDRSDVSSGLETLKSWWDTYGAPNKDSDREPVQAARIHGGRMALRLTALLPVVMFFGYLLLVLYFRSQGGYRTVEIGADKQPHETGPAASTAELFEDSEPRSSSD